MTCTGCGTVANVDSQFCSNCGRMMTTSQYGPAQAQRSDKLVRPRAGRWLAGVCAGFAQRYGWDVSMIRLVVVLAHVVGVGTPFLAYLIAWIVMPNEQLALPMRSGAGPGSMGL